MTGRPARAPTLLALVWLAGVVVATSVGLLAVRLVAAQVGDPAVVPLSAAAAASAAATPAGPAPSTPTPTPTGPAPAGSAPAGPAPGTPTGTAAAPAPSPAAPQAVARAFSSAGGDIGVQCAGRAVRLLYATPAAGFAVDERSAVGSEAEVRFEGAGTRVRLRVGCSTGQPRLLEQRSDPAGGGDPREDGGGGDDDGGGADDGGGGGGRDDGGGGDDDGGGRGGDDD